MGRLELLIASEGLEANELDISEKYEAIAGSPGNGPYVRLTFYVRDGLVLKVTGTSHGCLAAREAGAKLAQLLHSRTMDAVKSLDRSDVRNLLGALPEGKEYIYDLYSSALSGIYLICGGQSNA